MRWSLIMVLGALLVSAPAAAKDPKIEFAQMQAYEPSIISEEQVEMFITNKPDYKYQEVGFLTYRSWDYQPKEIEIYKLFKRRAAELGVDGIIIMPASGNSVSNNFTRRSYSFTDFKAVAIKKISVD